jgi:hypothetical protein|tara:strand:+ start:822 stop:1055 length:234 start_codon:yes stop_codon:yes gene_type:complete
MNIQLSIKNILIFLGLISAAAGNIFIVGKLYSDFEVFKTELTQIKIDQSSLEVKQELLELNYKIKSLRLELDGAFEG